MSELANTLASVIRQNDPEFQGLDFTALRREGLTHIGNLSGKIWTDHNVHDPGVTILEVLVYALIDLGYRTRLPIEDLLALDGQIEGENADDNFMTPLQALTCNPVTALDYRKLLLNLDGIRNAWVEPSDGQEQRLWAVVERTRGESPTIVRQYLSCTQPILTGQENNEIESCEILLNGLWQVLIQAEKGSKENEVFNKAVESLSAHRNLCEDFTGIGFLCEEEVGICAEVELEVGANPEQVYEEMLRYLYDFISPRVRYYTLQEMLDKGRTMEEIYAGRPYTNNSFGFVDEKELEAMPRRRELHRSDLYKEMSKAAGVKSIRQLKIQSFVNGVQTNFQPAGTNWVFHLAKHHAPLFSFERSCITLTTQSNPISLDKDRVHRRLAGGKPSQLPLNELDKAAPLGSYPSGLGDYFSIQHDFPRNYGIGLGGLIDQVTPTRQAQALQLKGYLLFFDQVLADYLAQLANLRKLFSLKQESQRPQQERHHYFAQRLSSVPEVEKLVRFFSSNFESLSPGIPFASPVADSPQFAEQLKKLKETLRGTLVLNDICNPASNGLNSFAFDSAGTRNAILEKIIRDMRQGDMSVEVWQDEAGCFFLLRPTEVQGIVFIGTKRYLKDVEAREAANLAIFLGGSSNNYNSAHRANGQNGLDYFFELSFHPIEYLSYLQNLLESDDDYCRRREGFLDHLLSRFAEQFNEYALLSWQASETEKERTRNRVEVKSKLLSQYEDISRNRGKGFNYLKPAWQTDNVSGFEKRAAALAGMEQQGRRSLCHFEVVPCSSQRYELRDIDGNALYSSSNSYKTKAKAKEQLRRLVQGFTDEKRYPALAKELGEQKASIIRQLLNKEVSPKNSVVTRWAYSLVAKDADGQARKSRKEDFESLEAALQAIPGIAVDFAAQTNGNGHAPQQLMTIGEGQPLYLDFEKLHHEIKAIKRFEWQQKGGAGKKPNKSKGTLTTKEIAINDFLSKAAEQSPILQTEQAWRWSFEADFGVNLLATRCFPDTGFAQHDWGVAREVGSMATNFTAIRLDDQRYALELKTGQGALVAKTAPVRYVEIQPNDLVERIRTNLRESQSPPQFSNIGKGFGYDIRDKADRVFLHSYFVYRSAAEALGALLKTHEMGKEPTRYVISADEQSPDFYFWLMDETEEPLASPLVDNSLDELRKDFGQCPNFFKKNRPPVTIVPAPDAGQWLFKDASGNILLQSKEHPSPDAAFKSLQALLPAMTQVDNYRQVGDGKEAAVQFFDKGKLEAVHPHYSVSPNEVVGLVQAALQAASWAFTTEERPAGWRYIYQWPMADGGDIPALESQVEFGSDAEAQSAYRQFRELLPDMRVETNGDRFALRLSNENEPRAVSHAEATGKAARAERLVAWLSQYERPLQVEEEEQIGRASFQFRVLKKDEPSAIHPCHFDSKAEAEAVMETLCGTPPPSDYLILDSCQLLYVRHHIKDKSTGELVPQLKKWHYALSTRNDAANPPTNRLFVSFQAFDTEADALAAYTAEYLNILRIARLEDNYGEGQLIVQKDIEQWEDEGEPAGCPTTVPLAVVAPSNWDVTALVKKAKSHPLRSTKEELNWCDGQELDCEDEEAAKRKAAACKEKMDNCQCGESAADGKERWHFQVYDQAADRSIWRSPDSFERPEEAMQAFYLVLNLLENQKNCRVLCMPHPDSKKCEATDTPKAWWVGLVEVLAESECIYDEVSAWGNARLVDDGCGGKTCELTGLRAFIEALDHDDCFVETQGNGGCFGFQVVGPKYKVANLTCTYETPEQRDSLRSGTFEQTKSLLDQLPSIECSQIPWPPSDNNAPFFEENGCYGFRLPNPQAIIPQQLPCFRPNPNCPEPPATTDDSPNNEGSTQPPPCNERFIWKSSACYPCLAAACEAFKHFRELAADEANYRPWQASDCGPYSLQIVDPTQVLAHSGNCYDRYHDSTSAMDRLRHCVDDEGLHLIEHILLRPLPQATTNDVPNSPCDCLLHACPTKECMLCWTDDQPEPPCGEVVIRELTDRCLEPSPRTCDEDDASTSDALRIHDYVPGADPYSFWATILLPGWTSRFREPELRSQFEFMLHREVPAGVALNILWLNPRSFCEAETAHKNWLCWKQTGVGPCGEATNPSPYCSLVGWLNNLRNEDFDCPDGVAGQQDCGCLSAGSKLPSDDRLTPFCEERQKQIANVNEPIIPVFTHHIEETPIKDDVVEVAHEAEEAVAAQMVVMDVFAPQHVAAAQTTEQVERPSKEATPVEIAAIDAPETASAELAAAVAEAPAAEVLESPPMQSETISVVEDIAPKKAKKAKEATSEVAPPKPPKKSTQPAETGDILKRLRQRKPAYLKAITDVSDAELRRTKSYQWTEQFIQSVPLPAQYEQLSDHILQKALSRKGGASDEQFWTLLRNATWHFLDDFILRNQATVAPETLGLMSRVFQKFRENGMDMGALAMNWRGEELLEMFPETKLVSEFMQRIQSG